MTQSPSPKLALPEFIAMMAMLSAIIAFAIDAMLPAMPEIAAELSPDAPNRAQLILTSFMLGMGLGTFVAGPLSDSLGRRPVMVMGGALYILGAALAWVGPTLEIVLLGRLVQGIGAAGPRIVSLALTRDLFSGRQMARIMSFVMMVFMIVPAVAPLIGALIIGLAGWRAVFGAFILFVSLAMTWYLARQPETLPPEARRPFALRSLIAGARQVLGMRVAQLSIAIQALLFAALVGTLSQIQPLFDLTYGRADSFPQWFALIAVMSGATSLLNAQLVGRMGMRRMVRMALGSQLVIASCIALATLLNLVPAALSFGVFVFWITSVFCMTGLTMGNINAIAMEPLGHIAGMAASVISALATVAGVALAVPLGMTFNGTYTPLVIGMAVIAALALLLLARMPEGSAGHK